MDKENRIFKTTSQQKGMNLKAGQERWEGKTD